MKADLHIHTDHSSDGTSSVKEMMKRAETLGLRCIAITDHNSMEGYREARVHAEGMILVPATEVSSMEGHILAYGISEEVPSGMGAAETVDAIHAQGGIAVAAHPFRAWSGLGESNVIDAFDAIEVLNSRSAGRGNRMARDLAERMSKPVTGGSDAHNVRYLADAYTILPDDCEDADDVIRAIKEGRTSVGGISRDLSGTLQYVMKAVTEWAGRGFRRM